MERFCVQNGGLAVAYMLMYVRHMAHISIRDLQKISGETIGALPGPTPVKSGDRTVGLLVPLKAANPDRLARVLARAEALGETGRAALRSDARVSPAIATSRQVMATATPTRDRCMKNLRKAPAAGRRED